MEQQTDYKTTKPENSEQLKPLFPRMGSGTQKYSVIYADPPWRYEHSKCNNRKIENKYNTMSLEDIKSMKVPASDNAVLFLWATAPKLREALDVIDAWGFEYKTNAVWDKKLIGMGYWFRGQHEHLLVATKGKFSPPPPEKVKSSVFAYRRGEHSKKPQQIRNLIADWYPNEKRLELFARQPNELFTAQDFAGWDVFGNDAIQSIQIV